MEITNLVLLVLGLGAWVVIVAKYHQLYKNRQNNQRHLSRELVDLIRSRQISEALGLAENTKDQLISQIAIAGIREAQCSGNKDQVQAKMDDILVADMNTLEKNLNLIAFTANLATLTGLVGTMAGLVNAFSSVSGMNGVERAIALHDGIQVAMSATIGGLVIAIPSFIAYAMLKNRAGVLTDDLSKGAMDVYVQLAQVNESHPQGPNWHLFRQ